MEYYISIDNEKRGPYSISELEGRGIDATSLVMPANGSQWTPAWQIEELRPVLMKKDAATGQPGTATEAATGAKAKSEEETDNQQGEAPDEEAPVQGNPIEEEAPYVEAQPLHQQSCQPPYPPQQPPRKKSHTGCLLGILTALVALIAVLILTCPKTEQHKEALANVITSTVTDAANDTDSTFEDDLMAQAFRTISNAFTSKVMQAAVDNLVTVDNHIIFSVGKVHYDGKDHTVSVGLLGHIFTVDKEDVKKAADKYYKNAEVKVENQLRQKAQQMFQENVVDPVADAIKGTVGSALGGLLDGMGLGSDNEGSGEEDELPADSI
ncbi:MAG: GYF domain-containing protein [Prevotella sp.]|nr:GYF domain-containing protein [Prevotella sp.]